MGGGVGWASLQKESEAHNDEQGDLMTDTPPRPPAASVLPQRRVLTFKRNKSSCRFFLRSLIYLFIYHIADLHIESKTLQQPCNKKTPSLSLENSPFSHLFTAFSKMFAFSILLKLLLHCDFHIAAWNRQRYRPEVVSADERNTLVTMERCPL